MDMIIGFCLGLSLFALVDKLNKMQLANKTAGENELCKDCKYRKAVIEIIDDVEVID